MKKKMASIVLGMTLLLPNTTYASEQFNNTDIKTALLADYDTGDILYSYNSDKSVEIASLTKLMTYLVAMDEVSKGTVKLTDQITVSEKAARRGGSSFKLKTGEVYTLETLLKSILLVSANDSCIAVAERISGSEEAFVKLMNKKAMKIGLERANFVSVNGFPTDETENTMTTKDLLKLSTYVIKHYPQILEITKSDKLIDEARGYEFHNTNPLIGVLQGVNGLKTGYTDKAGYCLVSTLDTNKTPSRLIGIVMGAGSERLRKYKSMDLLNIGINNNYEKKKILDRNISIDKVKITDSLEEGTQVYPVKDMYGTLKSGQNFTTKIKIDQYVAAPIKKGTVVGEIVVEYGDNIKKMDLTVKEDVKKSNFINMFFKSVKGLLTFSFLFK